MSKDGQGRGGPKSRFPQRGAPSKGGARKKDARGGDSRARGGPPKGRRDDRNGPQKGRDDRGGPPKGRDNRSGPPRGNKQDRGGPPRGNRQDRGASRKPHPGGRDGPRKPHNVPWMDPDMPITPDRWVGRGEAVFEGGAKPLLVWGGIPGETGIVKMFRHGQNQDRARWLRAEEPHETRREPPCDKYNRCGGCPLMHVVPEAQNDARLAMVQRLFDDQNLKLPLPTTVAASPDGDENYRHVVKLACGRSDWGRPRLGAYGRDSHDVLPIPNCRVATSGLRRAMSTITHHVLDLEVYPYDEAEEKGVLRHVVVRQSRLTGEMLVTLVVARRSKILNDLADRIAESLAPVAGVHMHINEVPGNAIFNSDENGIRTTPLVGKRTIEDEIAGVRMQIGAADFFQANPGTAELIVNDVLELTADMRERPVVDLFCGVGTFTLPLAKVHPWVGGIEVVHGAVERGRESARSLRLPVEFTVGPVAEKLPEMASRLRDAAPIVVLDPSRKGLSEEAFEPIENLNPARLLYVSCNPASLARDLRIWLDKGWSVDEIRAYDMFPQTAHLELLAVLSPPAAPIPTTGGPRRRIVR